jgi:two-component system NtrC family response regulator
MKPTVLIVDDDEDIRAQLKWALSQDYEVLLAGDAPSALAIFHETRPPVVLVDLGLPPKPADPSEGLSLTSQLLALDRLVKVVIITGQSERNIALQAVFNGAHDFLAKPVQVDELMVIVKRAIHMGALERDSVLLEKQLQVETFEGMLGNSRTMQQVFASIGKVSTSDAPVLILGESGTGKEMAALAVHRRSPRKDGPFVPINCGAIPGALLESELFGHERGAFTGAHARRKGRIESAAGGTLFLDEIGEISPALQVKLLRFLQEQTIERVGGREVIPINTRVIAATNTDLHKAMKAGVFREDLYYRLAVVVIQLPPLRERDDDISLLAQAFVRKFADETRRNHLPKFTRSALSALTKYSWPGNVRQLENCIRRAVVMTDGRFITEADFGLNATSEPGHTLRLREAREAVERDLVQRALQLHAGNISAAAEDLGISRPTLYELIEKLGLKRSEAE